MESGIKILHLRVERKTARIKAKAGDLDMRKTYNIRLIQPFTLLSLPLRHINSPTTVKLHTPTGKFHFDMPLVEPALVHILNRL